ncbi:MAG: hypothetical protein ACLGRW_02795 [Acidobacteriota bacterium]|jgi:hypothetical protein
MPEDLISFWKRSSFNRLPFAHPDDLPKLREILEKNGRWSPESDHRSFRDYLSGKRFNPDDNGLHLSLLPVPYAGNLRKASVVVLMLNPGFNYSDFWAESDECKIPEFRARLNANLQQLFDGDGAEYPFLFLDPQFCWHAGFQWWEKKLRNVIQRIAKKKCGGNYREALQRLSKRLACIELVPYHSASFKHQHLIEEKLPSIVRATEFVKNRLVDKAKAGKITLIVARGNHGWKLDRASENLIIYKNGEERGASLSEKSRGGKAVLRRFGIWSEP